MYVCHIISLFQLHSIIRFPKISILKMFYCFIVGAYIKSRHEIATFYPGICYCSESFSNTPFPITRRISLYLELISDKRGDRTSIIVMVALSANHYSTRAEIFDKFGFFSIYLINVVCTF